jgi:hypothetical protein
MIEKGSDRWNALFYFHPLSIIFDCHVTSILCDHSCTEANSKTLTIRIQFGALEIAVNSRKEDFIFSTINNILYERIW